MISLQIKQSNSLHSNSKSFVNHLKVYESKLAIKSQARVLQQSPKNKSLKPIPPKNNNKSKYPQCNRSRTDDGAHYSDLSNPNARKSKEKEKINQVEKNSPKLSTTGSDLYL